MRELQRVFYKEPPKESSSSPIQPTSPATNTLSYGHTSLRNLPTITSHDGIQTADSAALLPGYQFVWNIHNPQHCHMFHSILSGSAPWYFAHVFLPDVSSTTTATTTTVAAESSITEESATQTGEQRTIIDNIESYNHIQSELKKSSQDGGLYGTLLRVTDRRFHDEDGRIVLAVQALDKIRIHKVSSKPGTSPYLCTDVQLAPEEELMRMYFDKALMSSASFLSSHIDSSNDDENDDKNDDDTNDNNISSPSAVSGAARAAAVADALRCRKFECLPIFLEDKPKKPNNIDALEKRSSDSNAAKKVKDALQKKYEQEKAGAYMSVVQLVNYDALAYGSLDDAEVVTTHSLETYWENLAREIKSAQTLRSEEDLFSGTIDDSLSLFLPEEPPSSSTSSTPPSTSVEAVEMMEYHVWRSLDTMVRLLSMVSAATLPLPSQLLGLLPKRDDWPKDFVLEAASASLQHSGSTVGTSFQSPFVRVDQITASSSKNSSQYSPLRRAQRLSYAVWLLLDGIAITGSDSRPLLRSDVLRMTSILARLDAAKRTIDGVNEILKQLIPKDKSGDDKR